MGAAAPKSVPSASAVKAYLTSNHRLVSTHFSIAVRGEFAGLSRISHRSVRKSTPRRLPAIPAGQGVGSEAPCQRVSTFCPRSTIGTVLARCDTAARRRAVVVRGTPVGNAMAEIRDKGRGTGLRPAGEISVDEAVRDAARSGSETEIRVAFTTGVLRHDVRSAPLRLKRCGPRDEQPTGIVARSRRLFPPHL